MATVPPKNRTLYLSYDGLTDSLGQSQVLPYIVNLAKQGHEFHIVSFEKKDRFKEKKDQITRMLSGESIHWYPHRYHKSPPLISTLWDLLRMNRLAFAIAKAKNIQIVHCRSYVTALVGLRLKSKKKLKFIFDMRGFWPDERVEGGLWSLKNPFFIQVYRFFKRKEQAFAADADAIISLTNSGKEEMVTGHLFNHDLSRSKMNNAGQLRINENRITVIPCCVDVDLFDSSAISTDRQIHLKEKLQIREEKVLLYLGSVGTWYLLDEMLLYFKKFRAKFKSKFLFLTNEPSEFIYRQARRNGIDTDQLIIKTVSREEVPLYLSITDYGIFFIKPCYSKKASSATKLAELLSMGVNCITNSGVGDNDLFFEKYKLGTIIDISSGLDRIAVSGLFKTDPEFLRSVAMEHFSLEKGIKEYHKVYQEILKP